MNILVLLGLILSVAARADDFGVRIQLDATPAGCAAMLYPAASVMGRWTTWKSPRAVLRLHDALLQLPLEHPTEIIFSTLINSHLKGVNSLETLAKQNPNLRFSFWHHHYGSRNWAYGDLESSFEVIGLRGRPADLIDLVHLAEMYDQVTLVNPSVATDLGRVSVRLDDETLYLGDNLMPTLLASPLAGVLGRLGQLSGIQLLHFHKFPVVLQAKVTTRGELFDVRNDAVAWGGRVARFTLLEDQPYPYVDNPPGVGHLEIDGLTAGAAIRLLAKYPAYTLVETRERFWATTASPRSAPAPRSE